MRAVVTIISDVAGDDPLSGPGLRYLLSWATVRAGNIKLRRSWL